MVMNKTQKNYQLPRKYPRKDYESTGTSSFLEIKGSQVSSNSIETEQIDPFKEVQFKTVTPSISELAQIVKRKSPKYTRQVVMMPRLGDQHSPKSVERRIIHQKLQNRDLQVIHHQPISYEKPIICLPIETS